MQDAIGLTGAVVTNARISMTVLNPISDVRSRDTVLVSAMAWSGHVFTIPAAAIVSLNEDQARRR
jgi:hypothetical protein